MKKIGWRAFSLFAIVFVVMLVANAPATLMAKVVEGASGGQFVLTNATGTVWQGEARPAIRQHSGSLLAMEQLYWDIALLPLFTGKIIARMDWDNVAQEQPMLATISFKQIELRNAVIPLQAAVLGELSPMLQPVQLSGQIQIRSEQFTFSSQGLNGIAVADWLNAGSVMSAVNPLGSYRVNLSGAGKNLDISLVTLSGALLLEGKGSFIPRQGLRFLLTARAAAGSKGKLDELINNFGPESAPGVHTLNLMH
jgi:general secretion pathway protein N